MFGTLKAHSRSDGVITASITNNSHETWRLASAKRIGLNRLSFGSLCGWMDGSLAGWLAGWLAGYICHYAGLCHASFVLPNHETLISLSRTWQPITMNEQPVVCVKLS